MGKQYREDRREFLRSLGRGIALGGLLIGGASLMRKDGEPIETCVNDGICRTCNALKACGLPQALSFKQSRS